MSQFIIKIQGPEGLSTIRVGCQQPESNSDDYTAVWVDHVSDEGQRTAIVAVDEFYNGHGTTATVYNHIDKYGNANNDPVLSHWRRRKS